MIDIQVLNKEISISNDKLPQKYPFNRKKLKAIKYPVPALSNAVMLKKKLNNFDSITRDKLAQKMDKNINAYRQVRGDGNCFFRALAFSIISNKQVTYFSDIFTFIKDIKLDWCKKESIPEKFRQFYRDDLLKEVFRLFWEKQIRFFIQLTQDKFRFRNHKRALARMITQNPYMDFLIILYFRSVCLWAFKKWKDDFKEFLKGTEEDEITTYGQESQGVILNLMSKLFKLDIVIYELRKEEVINYEYNYQTKSSIKTAPFATYQTGKTIFLLFYGGHYDLFEKNPNALEQLEDQKRDQEFYDESSGKYVEGMCIQCDKKTEVHEENGLCLDCFNKSMANLTSFKKDQMIEGFCNQCQKTKKRVSEQMQLCESCLQAIQYAPSSIHPKSGYDHDAHHQAGTTICYKCSKAKTFSEIDYNGVCYSCRSKKEEPKSLFRGSKEEVNSGSSHITSLQNKMESKIGRQEAQKGNQGLMRAKLFDRSKPLTFKCRRCQKEVQHYTDLPESEHYCNKCYNLPKSPIKSSTKSNYKTLYTCKICQRSFQSQVQELKEREKCCIQCLKGKTTAPTIIHKSEIKPKALCRQCGRPEDQFYTITGGLCNYCRKGTSTVYRH